MESLGSRLLKISHWRGCIHVGLFRLSAYIYCDCHTFVLTPWGMQSTYHNTNSLTGIAMAVSIPATKMKSAIRRAMARFKWIYNNAPLLRDFLCKIRWYTQIYYIQYDIACSPLRCCLFFRCQPGKIRLNSVHYWCQYQVPSDVVNHIK